MHRRRRVVGDEPRVLDGDEVVFVALGLEGDEVREQLVLEDVEVAGVDLEGRVAGHVVLGAVGQHSLPGRRLPPEEGRLVEADEGPVAVGAHVQVFDAQIAVEVVEAPADAVDVVLHGRPDLEASLAEPAERLERGGQGRLVGQLVEVEVHAGDLDAALGGPLPQALDLGRGAAPEVLVHGPRGLAGPAELGLVGVAVGEVAIVQGVVDEPEVLGQDLGLGPGVADVGVGVLDEVHAPRPDRAQFDVSRPGPSGDLER
jgi:hypothetical protein